MAKEKVQADEQVPPEPTMAQVMARLADIADASQQVQKEQLKQTRRRSNLQVPGISVFNPRGDKDFPMPVLKCDFYAPWKMTPNLHSLDREEVELVNLLEPGNYRVDLVDGTSVPVCVLGSRNSITGAIEKLELRGQKDENGLYAALFTRENKQQFPALRVMLRQMIGDPAEDVLSMRKEVGLVAIGALAVSVGE